MFFAFVFYVQLGLADTAVDSHSPAPAPSSTDTETKAQYELDCIRLRMAGTDSGIESKSSPAAIVRWAPAFEAGFEKLKFTPLERAFFYSQVLQETGGLLQIGEAVKFNPLPNDAIATKITNLENDIYYDPKTNTAALKALDKPDKHGKIKHHKKLGSQDLGNFRGRGPLALSRCDNYLSAIHYINLLNAYNADNTKKKPYWETSWYFDIKGKKTQISGNCSDVLDEIEKQYRLHRDAGTFNVNAYGILRNPDCLSDIREICGDNTNGKMDSEKLAMLTSMAYWRGACDDEIAAFSKSKKFDEYHVVYKSDAFLESMSADVTACINGNASPKEKDRRLQLLLAALACRQEPESESARN